MTGWVPTPFDTPKDHLALSVAGAPDGSGGFAVMPGRFFAYEYDGIGNRLGQVQASGGKGNVAINGNFNQITSRDVDGFVRFSGLAAPGNRVVLSTGSQSDQQWSAVHTGSSWFGHVRVDNSAGPVGLTVTLTERDQCGNLVGLRNVDRIVPAANDIWDYDDRGNKISDSVYTYEWNELNQLISVMTDAAVAEQYRVQVEFTYDSAGRRASKTVYHRVYDSQLQAWVWSKSYSRKFAWSGWLLQAEFDVTGEPGQEVATPLRSYTWAFDAAGSVAGGAGGVGGLVAMTDHAAPGGPKTYQVVSDPGGNVIALIDPTAANDVDKVVASFDYTPYGSPAVEDNPTGVFCPFRFSTKYLDHEIGLYYYGYRYYDPTSGTWLNRDPIAEQGGLNLYAFCGNDPVNKIDPFGLEPPYSEYFDDLGGNYTTLQERNDQYERDHRLHDAYWDDFRDGVGFWGVGVPVEVGKKTAAIGASTAFNLGDVVDSLLRLALNNTIVPIMGLEKYEYQHKLWAANKAFVVSQIEGKSPEESAQISSQVEREAETTLPGAMQKAYVDTVVRRWEINEANNDPNAHFWAHMEAITLLLPISGSVWNFAEGCETGKNALGNEVDREDLRSYLGEAIAGEMLFLAPTIARGLSRKAASGNGTLNSAGGFRSMMEPAEVARYDAYWSYWHGRPVSSANPSPGFGNIGNQGPISPVTALNCAERWLGSGYTKTSPGSGVFRSADGLRQFRMTTRDLLPTHGNIGPHVHFEVPNPAGGPPLENFHVPVTP